MQLFRQSHRRGPRGFTLIELLIVVAIIGIIAAILVPNLLSALEKAKQKRTVADIQEIGTALMSWLTDQIGAGAAGASRTYDFDSLSVPLTASDVFGTLYVSSSMFYVATIPHKDGWGNLLDYAWSGQILGAKVMGIRAFARDGIEGPTSNPYPLGPFVTTHFDEDIVWADGLFIRYPAGTKAN
jgi:prepilin-type N-terminal cleavage/methylation domain-containing protein